MFSTSGRYYGSISPDKQFSVFTSRYNYDFLSEDEYADGKIFLYDRINDQIIDEAQVSAIGSSLDAQWNEESVFFPSDGYPTFKLPRKIKLPYTKKYPNGIWKQFEPDGRLTAEFQMLEVNNHLYRIGTEKSYDGEGRLSLFDTYTYFPDSLPNSTNEDKITQVIIQDSYREGKLTGHREYQKRAKRNGTCNCGTWIDYDREPQETTKYNNCYDTSWVWK